MQMLKLKVLSGILFLTYTIGFAQIQPIKPFGTVRAVVVGVSDYAEISDLTFAHRDAEAFAAFLQSETAWKVLPEHIQLLTNEEATMGKFVKALKWLTTETQPKDRAIIYFSGHGDVEESVGSRLGYLLLHSSPPVDYPIGGACPIEYLDAIIATLTNDKQAEVILITDACRSGKLAGSETGGPKLINSAMIDRFNNTVKIMSCEPEQFSLEGTEWGGGRGLFSYHLVNGLTGMADEDENDYIELFEIEDYVKKQVRTAARKHGKMQIPLTRGSQETRLSKVDEPSLVALLASEANQSSPAVATVSLTKAPQAMPRDTAYLLLLRQFEKALAEQHLMYPEEGSALSYYQALEKHTDIEAIKKEAKGSLIAALQDEAQVALNTYLQTPGKELANRWAKDNRYDYYPDYLNKAAELVGQEDYFFQDLQARADYFKGVNLRLKAEGQKDENLLQQAIQLQQKSLQRQPNTAHVFNELGYIYFTLNQQQAAIRNFQQAHELAPTWVLPLSNLAASYSQLKQYEEAEIAAKLAITRDTNLVLSQNNLGRIYLDQGKYEEAKLLFFKAIQLDANYPIPYYNLGKTYFGLGEYDQAEANYLKYAELEPADAFVYNALGYLYQIWDKPLEAEAMYRKCLEVDPTNRFGLYNFAFFYLKQTNYDKAISLFQTYKALEPQDQDVYYDMACAHALNGDHSAAIASLRILLEQFDYKNLEQISNDTDLDSLRELPEYQALIRAFFPEKN